MKMESISAKWNWKHSLLYITLIYAIIFFVDKQILQKLQISHDKIHLKKYPDLPLRFRYDGTFKILQVADMHYGMGKVTRCRDVTATEFKYCSDLNTTRFLKRIIEAEKPDFIAFTGDNIFGSSTTDVAESMIQAFGPAMELGLPWAAVLGNHDQESTMDREELMYFISLMDYSVAQVNPPAEDPSNLAKGGVMEKIDGFGNYDLRVYGPPGSHLANSSILNLFFLDSGDRETVRGVRTYGYIKESQLRWLHRVSEALQGQKQDSNRKVGAQLPGLAFFHIPIPETPQLYYQNIVGQFQEAVACSRVNSGVLQTLVSLGDIKAVFVGHDHTNDFCGNLNGIWFCYGGGIGYHGYGKAGWPRRARIILAEAGKGENGWMEVEMIKTWKRLDDQRLSKIDEQVLWEMCPSR
ncbi:hypothetical protein CISIN_1g0153621mg [Citrus sinensis]|uniref:Calcineurin-like phosphoesterase domain-containing protein n=1 Tax=Citrus sinensis TaxID=2711 RepID=A0A067F3L0_CITSI|nr:hypothetical protein CISIN_1g0153621mg [Citrus sinensis]KDO61953.1 hypothetical protein CISIN_1g0153621mg [Citrus sinensis]